MSTYKRTDILKKTLKSVSVTQVVQCLLTKKLISGDVTLAASKRKN